MFKYHFSFFFFQAPCTHIVLSCRLLLCIRNLGGVMEMRGARGGGALNPPVAYPYVYGYWIPEWQYGGMPIFSSGHFWYCSKTIQWAQKQTPLKRLIGWLWPEIHSKSFFYCRLFSHGLLNCLSKKIWRRPENHKKRVDTQRDVTACTCSAHAPCAL